MAQSYNSKLIKKRQHGGIPGRLDCNGPWDPTDPSTIQDGIDYILQKFPGGWFHFPPGIGLCSRISCSWKAAIVLCHDRNEDLWAPTE